MPYQSALYERVDPPELVAPVPRTALAPAPFHAFLSRRAIRSDACAFARPVRSPEISIPWRGADTRARAAGTRGWRREGCGSTVWTSARAAEPRRIISATSDTTRAGRIECVRCRVIRLVSPPTLGRGYLPPAWARKVAGVAHLLRRRRSSVGLRFSPPMRTRSHEGEGGIESRAMKTRRS